METYEEVLENARKCMGPYCKACFECNGKACRNKIPGPGAKGRGDVAIRNFDKWQEIRVHMDTLTENIKPDMSLEMFGKKFKYPIFVGPVGAVNLHYGDKYNDLTYNDIMVSTCARLGISAFTGDGVDPQVMIAASQAIAHAGGMGVPTIKPWNINTIKEKIDCIKPAHPFAVAMDIDAAGLPFLKNMTPPAGSKTVAQMKEIIDLCEAPFIIKGIMTVKGALKARDAGASAIVVSNHGGRVLDQCLSTAEVLKDIVDAVGNDMKIFVDGGIRNGADIFKVLALGADAVLIARPFVTALYGGEDQGIEIYLNKLTSELEDMMSMCGAASLKDITRDMIQYKMFHR